MLQVSHKNCYNSEPHLKRKFKENNHGFIYFVSDFISLIIPGYVITSTILYSAKPGAGAYIRCSMKDYSHLRNVQGTMRLLYYLNLHKEEILYFFSFTLFILNIYL